jgi:hypothetical protein
VILSSQLQAAPSFLDVSHAGHQCDRAIRDIGQLNCVVLTGAAATHHNITTAINMSDRWKAMKVRIDATNRPSVGVNIS